MSIIKTQTETKVETDVQKKDAKKILFDWADVENENEISNISKDKLTEFSTAYESDKLKKIYDNYDLVSYVKDTGTTDEKLLKQSQKIEKEFNQVAEVASAPATAHIEFQKLSTPKVASRKDVKAKLNFRGKLMVFGYSAVVAVLGFLAIFNIVQINNLNSANAQIQSEIRQSENSLSDLYNIYKDWNLVIAAYNCGPGNVNKAIHRANGATDYWSIYNYLPKETRGYVPAFIAANYIMNYYCDHNICPMETQLPIVTDTLHISKDLHFQQIADLCNIDLESLHALNPQYKTEVIPGNSMECILRLPQQALNAFIDAKDSIYTYKAAELFTKRKSVTVKNTAPASSGKAQYYKVRRGDTLSGIAVKYKTTVSRLRSLNGIKGNRITAGKSIRVR